jgi:hypothetical protein
VSTDDGVEGAGGGPSGHSAHEISTSQSILLPGRGSSGV